MDSQWQIYQVFEKERAALPHRNAGSVHAPDAEMAMENARDVFARRPTCLSLWVVPERAIFSVTAQELENDARQRAAAQDDAWQDNASAQTFLVFQKQGQTARETFVVHVGQVEALSPENALARARETFSDKNVFVWWLIPERAIVKSEDSDAPSMFDPALEKKYRNHLSYPVEPIMRELKSAQEMLERDE